MSIGNDGNTGASRFPISSLKCGNCPYTHTPVCTLIGAPSSYKLKNSSMDSIVSLQELQYLLPLLFLRDRQLGKYLGLGFGKPPCFVRIITETLDPFRCSKESEKMSSAGMSQDFFSSTRTNTRKIIFASGKSFHACYTLSEEFFSKKGCWKLQIDTFSFYD
jgi:hypothetical protein